MEKPTLEQLAWVFLRLKDHLEEGGSFRSLIYDRMGLGPDAYEPLVEAGAKDVADAIDWIFRVTDMDVEVEMSDDEDTDDTN